MRRGIIMLLLCISVCYCYAQSVETGFVKEYNGNKAKTPLAGVELNVNGAPSTVSDSQGRYELRFALLKPGEAIRYNEIYKSGYVIFNKDALEYWRISNNKKPFVIVMCKESMFRELKKKFYGIIEKSYRDEYLKQVAIAQQAADNAASLETKLKKLKEEYDKKLSNINTYVELFARIDRSEMDSIVGRALSLIEEGKIDEGIKVYEELKLLQQVELQLDKWHSGENMRQLAEEMIQDSQKDLVVLTEKLQQQIGLYEMGGSDYTEKRIEMIAHLVDIYRQLNNAFEGNYNEELGTWMCNLTDLTKPWEERKDGYREAASLPSWHGLINLGNRYNILAYNNSVLVDSTRFCYQQALQMVPDSLKPQLQDFVNRVADFYVVQNHKDTIYYKVVGDANTVYVSKKTGACCNLVSGEMEIPQYVEYQGIKYNVIGISAEAFFKNKHLKKVILPNSISSIGQKAFDKCNSLDTIVINSDLRQWRADAIPPQTSVILPKQIKDDGWIVEMLQERLNYIHQVALSSWYAPTKNLLLQLLAQRHIDKEKKAWYNICMADMEMCYGDTVSCLKYCIEGNRLSNNQYDIYLGNIYYKIRDYQHAYQCFIRNMDDCDAGNKLAYMYARGEYVEQDFDKALELIDNVINTHPNSVEHYIDSKGEIYLMMGKRDSAMVYWNKVLEINPDFDKSLSDLYKQLYPQQEDSVTTSYNHRFRDYVNILQLVAGDEYRIQREAFYEIEYEEMLAIGIIAIQVMMKNKTEEQLKGFSGMYIGTALRWAIRNELRIRYDWYWSLYDSAQRSMEAAQDEFTDEESQEIDTKQLKVRQSVYQTALMMYRELNKKYVEGYSDYSPCEKEVLEAGKVITSTIDAMSPTHQAIFDDLMNGVTFNDLKKKYNITIQEVIGIFDKIKGQLVENHLKAF